MGKVFAEFMDCEVIHLGGPNDNGIDLLLVRGSHEYAVQVKRRATEKSEAVSGIREFLGAMLLRGSPNGFFVSTAPRFSRQAQTAAKRARDQHLVEFIELVDASRLTSVCQLTARALEPPWQKFALSPSDAVPPFEEQPEAYFVFPAR